MDEIRLSMQQATIILGGAIGFLLGLIPLIVGIFKRKIKIGIVGLLVATAGGALAGVIISIPAMAVFTWLILRKQFVAPDVSDSQSDPDTPETKEN